MFFGKRGLIQYEFEDPSSNLTKFKVNIAVIVGFSKYDDIEPLAKEYYYSFSEASKFTLTFIKPKQLNFKSEFPIHDTSCNDLNQQCLLRESFNYQLNQYPNDQWFFFCDENTFINLKNLYRYVTNLNAVYGNASYLFRSGMKYEINAYKIDLKAGFLISRLSLEYFNNHDKSFELFRNTSYKNATFNDGAFLSGDYCSNLDLLKMKSTSSRLYPRCPDSNQLFPLNQIVSYFKSENQYSISIINSIINSKSNKLYYFYKKFYESSYFLCYLNNYKSKPKNIYGYSVEELLSRKSSSIVNALK